mgnify:FL=1
MNATINVLFYIKRAKINSNGLVPIFIRITVDGKRIDKSTGKYVLPDKWSVETSRLKGNSEESRSLNNHLDLLRNGVFEIEKTMLLKGLDLNFENFKNEYFGIESTKRYLVPIFEDHNKRVKELVGKEYAIATYKRYETSLRHLKEFLDYKFKISDIDIEKIDYAFITDYEFFLRTKRSCSNNTAIKYVKNFHKVVNICLANGWLGKSPFMNYKPKIKEVVRDYLLEDEINAIRNKKITSYRLDLVRDIFLFSCYTGLAYIDVKQLKKSNISIGIDGDKWIFKSRQKTDVNSKIPILPPALEILEKYKEHPKCLNEDFLLPILSNQKMNAYLKEIADICGINKELTFHIARHTFATTVTLSNGVPIETVSKMLGHTNLKTTQHYAKILDKKISEDMQILKVKFNANTQTQSKSVNY